MAALAFGKSFLVFKVLGAQGCPDPHDGLMPYSEVGNAPHNTARINKGKITEMKRGNQT